MGDRSGNGAEHVPDLRVMEVPVNRLGLGVGQWLRWDELRIWLEARDDQDTIDAIEHQLLPEMTLTARAIQVRR